MLHEPPLLSCFESLILRSKPGLATHLMAFIGPADIGKLGLLNTRMRFWYHSYRRKTWDMIKFVRHYVNRPSHFLTLMDGKNALIYGESVLRYFLRCTPTRQCALDVCVTVSKVNEVHRVLVNNGYSHPTRDGMFSRSILSQLVTNTTRRSTTRDYSSWFLTGDRSVEPEAHAGFKFRYRNRATGMKVNLILVRCEPYRHVLANSISTSSIDSFEWLA